MIVSRGNQQRASAWRSTLSALSISLLSLSTVGLLLLAGCSDNKFAEDSNQIVAAPNDKIASAIRRVLSADHAVEHSLPPCEEQPAEQDSVAKTVGDDSLESCDRPQTESESFAWTQASEAQPEPELQLPPVSETQPSDEAAPEEIAAEQTEVAVEEVALQETEVAVAEEETPVADSPEAEQPFAILLPPQIMAETTVAAPVNEPIMAAPAASVPSENIAAVARPVAVQMPEPKTPELDGLSDEERRLVEQVIRDCSASATGVLTDARVNEMATANIREANVLANRGAQYAAKQKLIEVLRMISQAKDVHEGDRQHTSALAAGLRALEEAEDFAPRGTQLEAELEISLITAAHRTPIARRVRSSDVLPRQMMDRYFRYAQVKLAASVAGEPSGSMALYALGKVSSQMGQLEPDRNRLAHRRAVAFQQAALLAHNQNYLAAHELAVLLAESGYFAEAEDLLKQVVIRQPNATVYRNLAHVQQRMGRGQQAANSRALAAQLAGQNSPGASQIRWVGPEAFGQAQAGPTQLGGALPMAPRPPYDQRTAMAPPPRQMQKYGPIPPGSWR